MIHDARMVPAAAAAWCAAASVTLTGSGRWPLIVASLLIAAAALGRSATLAASGLVLGVLAGAAVLRVEGVAADPVSLAAGRSGEVEMELSLVTDPRSVGAAAEQRSWFTARARGIRTAEGLAPSRALVEVWVSGPVQAAAGDRLLVRARLAEHDSTGRGAQVRVRRILRSEPGPPWWRWSLPVRAAIADAAERGPPGGAALVPALVHGDESAQDERTAEEFRRSGLTHLLAVSGTNLTLVLGCVLIAGRAVGVSGRGRIALGILAVAGFVILARPEPSVLRAAVMGAVAVLGLRRSARGGLRALGWAVVVLLAWDPWLSTTAGFILSVSATAGILVLVPWWSRLLDLPEPIALGLTVPLAAQLACAPMLVVLSGEVSLVAVAANALAAPFVAPATVLGLLGGLVALAWPAAGGLLGAVAAGSAEVVVQVARHSARLEGASLAWPGSWWTLALLCAAIAALVPVVVRSRAVLVAVALAVALVIVQPWGSGWPPDGWVMIVCDVGQGDAAVLPAGELGAIVVDTGPDPVAVDRCLRSAGIGRIALLLISHAHDDHDGAVDGVAAGREVAAVATGPAGRRYLDGVRHVILHEGHALSVGPVALEVLGPAPEATASENDDSLIVKARVGDVTVLLTGDLGGERQRALARRHDVRCDVLKVPHHGSGDHAPELFAATGARIATISVGADNRHGHPHPDLLATLARTAMVVARTDVSSDLAIVAGPQGLTVAGR